MFLSLHVYNFFKILSTLKADIEYSIIIHLNLLAFRTFVLALLCYTFLTCMGKCGVNYIIIAGVVSQWHTGLGNHPGKSGDGLTNVLTVYYVLSE